MYSIGHRSLGGNYSSIEENDTVNSCQLDCMLNRFGGRIQHLPFPHYKHSHRVLVHHHSSSLDSTPTLGLRRSIPTIILGILLSLYYTTYISYISGFYLAVSEMRC